MKFPTLAIAAALALAGCATAVVQADHHPAYLRALSDLRAARWNLNHRPGGFLVSEDESAAIEQINLVIKDIKAAAIDDGKNLEDHPPADETLDNGGRLRRAMELLRHAHQDLDQAEDEPEVRELRNRSLGHLDLAIGRVQNALDVAMRNRN